MYTIRLVEEWECARDWIHNRLADRYKMSQFVVEPIQYPLVGIVGLNVKQTDGLSVVDPEWIVENIRECCDGMYTKLGFPLWGFFTPLVGPVVFVS